MQRLPWTPIDNRKSVLPKCFALIPETDAERADLRQSFEDGGVQNSMAFDKMDISGRLDIPSVLSWEPDGAIRVAITLKGDALPIDAWFWLVECNDGSGRRFAWWNTRYDREGSHPWS